jgi:hypothetical protein
MNTETEIRTATTDAAATPTTEKGIWQRLPQESPASFDAFFAYLELGPDADLSDVAQKTGKTYGAIKNLSWRYQWLERAAAWRQHLSSLWAAGFQRTAAQTAELWARRQAIARQQEWERYQQLLLLVNEAMAKLCADPNVKVSIWELCSLMRLSSECARRAITPVPVEELPPDINSDPIILEFRANLAKVVEGFESKPVAASPESGV